MKRVSFERREAATSGAISTRAMLVLILAATLASSLLVAGQLAVATTTARPDAQASGPTIRSRFQSVVPNYLDQMQNVLELAEHIQLNPAPGDEPKNWASIRDAIAKTTDLISKYQKNGLTNMPNLPNLPGLNTVLRTPDKLLRVELSMLQQLVLMAESMMENPILATMNLPKDLATMVSRMADQVEQ